MSNISVLALAGSPRKGGNSDTLLEKVLDGIRSVEDVSVTKIYTNNCKMVACQSCGGCEKDGVCVFEDDMSPIYEHLLNLSILVVASPIYFNNISAQLKAVIDRCQSHWYDHYVLKSLTARTNWPRKGIFVSARGQKGLEIFKYPDKTIKAFFSNENIDYAGNVFVDSVDEKGAITGHSESLDRAFALGKETIESFGKGR